MKRYSVARRHSVGTPRTERCSEPSGLQQPRPDDRRVRMRVGERDELLDRVARRPRRPSSAGGSSAPRAARMPALLPAPMPRVLLLDDRTVRESARARVRRVPSVEPWSTTIVSWPRTDSRHRSSHGIAFQVTTTTETSAIVSHPGPARAGAASPRDDHEPGKRQHDRHQEEEEPGREGVVGVDAEPAEEADEERLAHARAR